VIKYQDRQCTYNVIEWRVRITIVAMEKQRGLQILNVVCSLSYPICKAYAPYYIVICGLSESIIFFSLSQKKHNFWKKLLNTKKNLFFLCLCLKYYSF
jgi:hypothetical protein